MTDPYARLAGVYDDIVVDPCFASWADFLVATWAADPTGVRTVLDLCCGTGLMTDELRGRGMSVVGLDASPAMLALARARLGAQADLIEATLPGLPDDARLAGPFDAVVSTFDGLNYLDEAALRSTFAQLVALLRPGGWLVFDLHAEPMLAYVRDNPVVLGEHGDARYSVTYVVDEVARTCRSIMALQVAERPEAGFVEEHRQHLHSDAAVRAALADAGLTAVAVTAEYTTMPVNAQTLRATWVARSPAAA